MWVDVDVLMTHDVCGPGTVGIFHQQFGRDAKVWDADRVVVIPDHYIFTADLKSYRNVQLLRSFVKEQGLRYYYDPDFIEKEGDAQPVPRPDQDELQGRVPQGAAGGGARPAGRDPARHRQPHLHGRGVRAVRQSGVGNTDAAFTLGTGKTWLKVPPTMRFTFDGQIPPYLTAKDLILAVIGDIGVDGATYKTMYFAGEGISLAHARGPHDAHEHGDRGGRQERACATSTRRRLQYVRARSNRPEWTVYKDDADARCDYEADWDLSTMEPMVAKPHSAGQQGHGPQLLGRQARPGVHRELHRREDHRHDLRRQHPQGRNG